MAVTGVVMLIAAAVLLGAAFGALSIGLALLLRKEESVVGAVQMLLLPLTFLSSVWMQRNLMPGWIQDVSRFNPLEWAVQAGREAVSASPDWGLVLSHCAYCSPSRSRARGLQHARVPCLPALRLSPVLGAR